MERVSGFIAAEKAAIPRSTAQELTYALSLADCGAIGESTLIPASATYNVLVRGDSTRATVKVTVKYLNFGLDPERPITLECSTRGRFESEAETTIKQRAESK